MNGHKQVLCFDIIYRYAVIFSKYLVFYDFTTKLCSTHLVIQVENHDTTTALNKLSCTCSFIVKDAIRVHLYSVNPHKYDIALHTSSSCLLTFPVSVYASWLHCFWVCNVMMQCRPLEPLVDCPPAHSSGQTS